MHGWIDQIASKILTDVDHAKLSHHIKLKIFIVDGIIGACGGTGR